MERYFSGGEFFKNIFGEKVYRISIDAGFTCPNRDGTKGTGGCIYCNAGGSKAAYVNSNLDIPSQIEYGIKIFKEKKKVSKFIAYFQAFSNTYAPLERLKKIYQVAIDMPEIAGISIGTRPDCIDDEKLDFFEELAKKKFLMIEYGVQTLNNKSLEFINRGHSAELSIEAIKKTKERKNIFVLAHLILLLPYDNFNQMLLTVKKLVKLGIDGFKFHHLYVEKGTALENLYYEGKIKLLELKEYIEMLGEIISYIPKNIAIHRLFGECDKNSLVAPEWTLYKTKNLNILRDFLSKNDIYQGKFVS